MNLHALIFGPKKSKLTTHPKPDPFVDFHLLEAQRLFRSGDYHQALHHIEEVMGREPTNANAYRLRGVIRYELKDNLKAAEDLQHALRIS